MQRRSGAATWSATPHTTLFTILRISGVTCGAYISSVHFLDLTCARRAWYCSALRHAARPASWAPAQLSSRVCASSVVCFHSRRACRGCCCPSAPSRRSGPFLDASCFLVPRACRLPSRRHSLGVHPVSAVAASSCDAVVCCGRADLCGTRCSRCGWRVCPAAAAAGCCRPSPPRTLGSGSSRSHLRR